MPATKKDIAYTFLIFTLCVWAALIGITFILEEGLEEGVPVWLNYTVGVFSILGVVIFGAAGAIYYKSEK